MANTYEWLARFAQSAGVLYFIALFIVVFGYRNRFLVNHHPRHQRMLIPFSRTRSPLRKQQFA